MELNQANPLSDHCLKFLQVTFPKTMFWEVCLRCECESLVNSKQYLAMCEQEINKDRSRPSFQKLETMAKRHIDQKIRKRNIQARNERVETGVFISVDKKQE